MPQWLKELDADAAYRRAEGQADDETGDHDGGRDRLPLGIRQQLGPEHHAQGPDVAATPREQYHAHAVRSIRVDQHLNHERIEYSTNQIRQKIL